MYLIRQAIDRGDSEWFESGAAGLRKASVVNVSLTRVVDRRRLNESMGTLDERTMRRVDDGLRLALGL